MQYTVSTASHRGKVRQKNEDNLYADGLSLPQQNDGLAPQTMQAASNQAHLFGVFDGMGGYAAGERASRLAVEAAQSLCAEQLQTSAAQDLLLQICALANESVCKEMLDGQYERIGTTASMLHFAENTYTVCNVGDSPMFLQRAGVLYQLHEEHTERANYERVSGKPAPANKKFRLTQNIGIFTDEMLIEPYCASDAVLEGDLFLISSDGLTDMVSTQTISQVLAGPQSTQEKVEILLNMALENGGRDNITIILIAAQAEPPRKAPVSVLPVWITIAILLLALAVGIFLATRGANKDAPPEPTEITDPLQTTAPSTAVPAPHTSEIPASGEEESSDASRYL